MFPPVFANLSFWILVLFVYNGWSQDNTPDGFKPHSVTNFQRSVGGMEVQNLKYTSCGSNDVVRVNQVKISPDQKLTLSVDVLQNLTAPLMVDLTIMKQMRFLGWTKIPCFLGKVGSCTYRDICNLKAQYVTKCQTKMAELGRPGMPCTCPIAAKTYAITDLQIGNNQHHSLPGWMASGNFKVTAVVRANGREIGCHNILATIAKI